MTAGGLAPGLDDQIASQRVGVTGVRHAAERLGRAACVLAQPVELAGGLGPRDAEVRPGGILAPLDAEVSLAN